MKCPKCNQEIDDDSIFCEYCGSKVEHIVTDQTNDKAPIEDRLADVVRKTVGGVVKTFHEGKNKAKTHFPIIKERTATAIKNFNENVVSTYNEISDKVKSNKKTE